MAAVGEMGSKSGQVKIGHFLKEWGFEILGHQNNGMAQDEQC